MAQTAATSETPSQQTRSRRKDKAAKNWLRDATSEEDDDRTSTSKKISWILRHGAKTANVEQDAERYVKFTDLCKAEILKDKSAEDIWKVIVDFNGKKLRYEIKEDPDGTRLRAHERNAEYRARQRKASELGITILKTEGPQGLRKDAPDFMPNVGAAPSPGGETATTPTASAMAQAHQTAYLAAQQLQWMYPMMPFMNPFMWQQPVAPGKLQGRIKSFNQDKGFGFIECPQTFALYNRDVFLHKSQIGDLHVGSMVQFSCEINKQSMPQAKDVQLLGAPVEQGGTKGGGEDGRGKGNGKNGKRKGKGEGGGKGGKAGKGEKSGDSKRDKPTEEKAEVADAQPETPEVAVASEGAAATPVETSA